MSDHPPRRGQSRHHDGDHRSHIEVRHGVLQPPPQAQTPNIDVIPHKSEIEPAKPLVRHRRSE